MTETLPTPVLDTAQARVLGHLGRRGPRVPALADELKRRILHPAACVRLPTSHRSNLTTDDSP